jgi:hypothetical protein
MFVAEIIGRFLRKKFDREFEFSIPLPDSFDVILFLIVFLFVGGIGTLIYFGVTNDNKLDAYCHQQFGQTYSYNTHEGDNNQYVCTDLSGNNPKILKGVSL